ncbi:MAG: hypothetical protein OXC30_04630 [Alphaproteobacteria bacterium]|nr:hypothetical protein [Alphaproteobacteria bacterium]
MMKIRNLIILLCLPGFVFSAKVVAPKKLVKIDDKIISAVGGVKRAALAKLCKKVEPGDGMFGVCVKHLWCQRDPILSVKGIDTHLNNDADLDDLKEEMDRLKGRNCPAQLTEDLRKDVCFRFCAESDCSAECQAFCSPLRYTLYREVFNVKAKMHDKIAGLASCVGNADPSPTAYTAADLYYRKYTGKAYKALLKFSQKEIMLVTKMKKSLLSYNIAREILTRVWNQNASIHAPSSNASGEMLASNAFLRGVSSVALKSKLTYKSEAWSKLFDIFVKELNDVATLDAVERTNPNSEFAASRQKTRARQDASGVRKKESKKAAKR